MSDILTYDDIVEELRQGRLITNGIVANVEACSYDLRVGTIFREGLPINGVQGQAILQPGDIVSFFTLEELDLPPNVTATAFAINAMSSQGILVLNPGHIDPGFKGPLTVRAINLRATSKPIDLGTKIFTVVFERLATPTSRPYPAIPDTRQERENKFNEMDFSQNPRSVSRLVMLGKDKPLMTGDEVDRRIRDHWTTKLTVIGTVVGIIIALIATVFTIIGLYRADPAQVRSLQAAPVSSPHDSPSGSQGVQNTNAIPSQPK